jgi:hypothetical protein
MKSLSLKQPFAELLVSGKKTVELRKWNTKFRGKFLIHASKKIDKERARSLGIDYTKLTTGAIIGTAILYNVKEYQNKADFEKDKISIVPISRNLISTSMDLWSIGLATFQLCLKWKSPF